MQRHRRGTRLQRLASGLALALAASAPASAHLLTRGIPLSELAASSPAAVIGRVESADGAAVTLAVEEAVLGGVPAGPLRFALEGHHPPDYAPGSRVLVFLHGTAPDWRSRQTALDLVEIPASAAAREALVGSVRAHAGLRNVPDPAARIAQLKTLGLGELGSPSPRVRHEALLDLTSLAAAVPFGDAEVARVASLAGAADTPGTLAPGLVVLLATLRGPAADAALARLVHDAASAPVRARAARVVARRHGESAVPALRRALRDPALEVRLTAQRALERIDSSAARAALEQSASGRASSNDLDSTGRES